MIRFTNQKDSIKKTEQVKNKRSKKKALGGFLKIYTSEGRPSLLCLRKKGNGFILSRGAFYPQISRRPDFVFSRRECTWLLLSLQHQLGRKFVRVWNETWRGKSQRVIRLKKNFSKMVGE